MLEVLKLLENRKPLGETDYEPYAKKVHKYFSMLDCEVELEIAVHLLKEILGSKALHVEMLSAEILALY